MHQLPSWTRKAIYRSRSRRHICTSLMTTAFNSLNKVPLTFTPFAFLTSMSLFRLDNVLRTKRRRKVKAPP
ncbi:uncharacterized protein LY89DRAFT_507242 [Mollisia scopiformis]|uniref:Uncharacterized protein n=1 Tax=Mollisia scopiformis TaxID=149040 RepID=A0A194XGJ1_MOLSC|nr:uncharacterized protein LY89DRAFT_507242 [Mollisia scopiformis]KUJ18892.1 hypothetical protein LY89DRAFT_507242 [Mollisia scopiformis]